MRQSKLIVEKSLIQLEKYRRQTRSKWNYELFIKDNEDLPRNERNSHRHKVAKYVLSQKKLNYYDIIFLKRLEYFVHPTKGEDIEQLKRIYKIVTKDYYVSVSVTWKGIKLPLHEKYTFDYYKDKMKIFAKEYFKKETGHRLTIAIILGMPLSGGKLCFKDIDKENEFIHAMSLLINKTNIMTPKGFSKRMINATDTKKKKETILDYYYRPLI